MLEFLLTFYCYTLKQVNCSCSNPQDPLFKFKSRVVLGTSQALFVTESKAKLVLFCIHPSGKAHLPFWAKMIFSLIFRLPQ